MSDFEVVKDYCLVMLAENEEKKNHHDDYNKALRQVLRFVETVSAYKATGCPPYPESRGETS